MEMELADILSQARFSNLQAITIQSDAAICQPENMDSLRLHINKLSLGWFTLHYIPVNICVMGQQPDGVISESCLCLLAAFKSSLLPFLLTLPYLKCDG